MMPLWLKRDYIAVGMVLLSCTVGVIFMRIVVYYSGINSAVYGGELASSALFALPSQLLFFLVLPFCIYKFYGKRTFGKTLEYSSCGVFRPYFLFAVPLGVCVFMLTIGVSSAWTALLRATGYTVSSSSAPKPESFNGGYFVAEILLTALLPAVCEEFAMRGGVLSTARNTFKTLGCIVVCAIVFGLFHQNIRQVFYTALFGAFAAYITISTKSLYPAMIMHFFNNFCSVFFDYASDYNWLGGGVYALFDILPPWILALAFLLIAVIAAAIVAFMLYLEDKRVIAGKMSALGDAAFDATGKRVILFGEFDANRVAALEMEKEVYGVGYSKTYYKPNARDAVLVIVSGTITLLTTVFTYVWGFFY